MRNAAEEAQHLLGTLRRVRHVQLEHTLHHLEIILGEAPYLVQHPVPHALLELALAWWVRTQYLPVPHALQVIILLLALLPVPHALQVNILLLLALLPVVHVLWAQHLLLVQQHVPRALQATSAKEAFPRNNV